MHAQMWADRLRDEPRFRAAVDELWPYALGVLPEELRTPLPSARTGQVTKSHKQSNAALIRRICASSGRR